MTEQMPAAQGSATPRVAMVVANDVSTDTRVRKMALDLAQRGLHVTVFGVSPTGRRVDFGLGPALVTLLPVGGRLRTSSGVGRGFGKRHALSHELSISKMNYFDRQRTVGAEIGWHRDDYFKARAMRNRSANERARRRIETYRSMRERISSPAISRVLGQLQQMEASLRKWVRELTEQFHESRSHRIEKSISRRLARRYARYRRRSGVLERKLITAIERGDRPDWRSALPELHDYEIALGPVLEEMRPDVIHAQDVHLLGVAARAAARARWAGTDTQLIYDAHEYIAGLAHPRPAKAWTDLESEYIARADGVITVAPDIADLLVKDYGLDVRPTVVMNIPAPGSTSSRNLREDLGLSETETLLVYSGGMDETRGVHTLVRVLGHIPEVHLALVRKAETNYTLELEEIARDGGFRDRLHFAPFVEPHEVVSYLSSADIGVHTIVSGPINHEVTLPNKVFEYLHARLPIVISNCKAMSEFVSALGVGEVFISEDVDSLTEALNRVISNLDDYRTVFESNPQMLERYSWRSEGRKLFDLYESLLGFDTPTSDFELESVSSVLSEAEDS